MGKLKDSKTNPNIRAPHAINDQHVLDAFDCGTESLNYWLQFRVLRNESSGASRTYVVCDGKNVIGYYALATGAVVCSDAPGRIRRNMPDPIPVMVLGRLAVHKKWQNKGLGGDLLSDAIKRTLQAAQIAGIRAFVVHALNQEAKEFYEHHGFLPSSTDPMDLMISLKDAQQNLS